MDFLRKFLGQRILNYYHLAVAIAANIFYGFPARGMHVIGVTGTDGKTTTVHMIDAILRASGLKTAAFSTAKSEIAGEEVEKGLHTTTPSSFGLQRLLKKAKQKGVTHVVLETTSHALDQHRIWGINYETAALTNITHEHLDYHKTMAEYRRAKRRLFEAASKSENSTFVLNADDESFNEFSAIGADRVYSYGTKNSPLIWAGNIKSDLHGLDFTAHVPFGEVSVKMRLIGDYNVQNALAAVGAGLAYDVPLETIAKGFGSLEPVKGRMEIMETERGFIVGVDFAVTPNALESTLKFIRPKIKGRLIHMFGSAGERDFAKRPTLGAISDKYADIIILTRDDNRSEKVEDICEQIARGINGKERGKGYYIIPDRREAIRLALSKTADGDFVLLSGKGHEQSLNVDGKEVEWDERRVALEALRANR